MYTAQITDIKIDEANNLTIVGFILESGDIQEVRSLSFDGYMKSAEIKSEIKKYLDLFNAEQESAKLDSKHNIEQLQKEKKLDTMREELVNEVIE